MYILPHPIANKELQKISPRNSRKFFHLRKFLIYDALYAHTDTLIIPVSIPFHSGAVPTRVHSGTGHLMPVIPALDSGSDQMVHNYTNVDFALEAAQGMMPGGGVRIGATPKQLARSGRSFTHTQTLLFALQCRKQQYNVYTYYCMLNILISAELEMLDEKSVLHLSPGTYIHIHTVTHTH